MAICHHTPLNQYPNGQTLVEFALALPVLGLLLLATMYMGLLLFNLHETASRVRGVHKNMERYANSADPIGLLTSDLDGYTLDYYGTFEQAAIIQATRDFEVPLAFIPPFRIVSSTAIPGRIFEDSTPTGKPADNSNPNAAIAALAFTYAKADLNQAPWCVESDWCYGKDEATGNDNPFTHLQGTQAALPPIIGLATPDTCEDPTVGLLVTDKYNEIVVEPECNKLEDAGTKAACLAGKYANAEHYIEEHITLAQDAGGCGGEPIIERIYTP